MNDGKDTPHPRLTEGNICGYSESVSHHSSVISSFSSSFVNIYAIFNAGAFAACASIIPTTYGQRVLAEFPSISVWTIVLFAVGFFSSSTLMAIMFQYSGKRYEHYRNILLGDAKAEKPIERIHLIAGAYILLFATIGSTLIGTIMSMIIIINTKINP